MSTRRCYLAVDLGAESGRVVAGLFDGDNLELEEVHRFRNGPTRVGDSMQWDAPGLFTEIKTGLSRALAEHGDAVVSVGVDAWGVDYALVDAAGELVGNPFHYRDDRTRGMEERAFSLVPRAEIYQATGIQFMFFNTLFQLLSELGTPALARADRLLFMPDLMHYWLTGRQVNERTIASTSQLLDPHTGDWARSLAGRLGIPTDILGAIVPPGTELGPLLPSLSEELGGDLKVVAPGSHDTACAVAAVPARGRDHVYLSSGTWSLMGVETERPIISEKSLTHGFTNEGGVCDTIRVLKNISGLWLVQECRRIWAAAGEELDYDQLARLAEDAEPFAAVIDPDCPEFATPGDMPARIRAFCESTGQTPPGSRGSLVRTILESLALKYRAVFEKLEDLLGRSLDTLHIVGGGTRNRLLNQFAACAVNRPVVAGPVEATSVGNVLMQMLAAGDLADLPEGREMVARSFATERYEPDDADAWSQAYARFGSVEGKP